MVSVIAELRVSGPGAVLTEDTLQDIPEAEVRIQYQGTSEKAGIVVRGCDFEAFEAGVRTDSSIGSFERVADFSDVRVYNITAGNVSTLVSELLAARDIQILQAHSPGGETYWRLRVRSPSRERLADAIDECRELGHRVQLDTLYSETMPPEETNSRCPSMNRLTDGQHAALAAAHSEGYFEVPRETSLAQLSQQFDIGTQAMSERLRRGVKTLLDGHFQQDSVSTES
ncbi:helix-turn-helix domain-containing protein [Haloferax sp. S1W]|uniref:helix-turn-helix domain-containing protein n=1 Tax=Haloferax sp. S1W TaxID=3377110 RepID=UPI0037C97451